MNRESKETYDSWIEKIAVCGLASGFFLALTLLAATWAFPAFGAWWSGLPWGTIVDWLSISFMALFGLIIWLAAGVSAFFAFTGKVCPKESRRVTYD